MTRDPLRPCPPPGARVDDTRTSSGLLAISRREGGIAAAAKAAEHTIKTGVRSEVTLDLAMTSARLASDVVPDPRTPRQIEADAWVKERGIHQPHPFLAPRRPR